MVYAWPGEVSAIPATRNLKYSKVHRKNHNGQSVVYHSLPEVHAWSLFIPNHP